MTETTVFRELDELLRAGILTEDEHAAAAHKLRARAAPHLVLAPHLLRARHAAASAAGQPRHAKPPRRRWPAGAAALVLFAAAVTTVVLLVWPKHHPAPVAQPPASHSLARSSPIILGSPVNSAVAINLGGANARITVAKLVAAPQVATKGATTYSASVTVVGVSGSFGLDPASFSAQSATGQSFSMAPTALSTLTARTVNAGQQVQASIAFAVPSGQRITAIVFTTPLGEQLGLWSTS